MRSSKAIPGFQNFPQADIQAFRVNLGEIGKTARKLQ
jgi:hypothetical protein